MIRILIIAVFIFTSCSGLVYRQVPCNNQEHKSVDLKYLKGNAVIGTKLKNEKINFIAHLDDSIIRISLFKYIKIADIQLTEKSIKVTFYKVIQNDVKVYSYSKIDEIAGMPVNFSDISMILKNNVLATKPALNCFKKCAAGKTVFEDGKKYIKFKNSGIYTFTEEIPVKYRYRNGKLSHISIHNLKEIRNIKLEIIESN